MKFEVKAEGRVYVWNLNAEFRKMLEPIAAEFGWTVEEFLRKFSAGRREVIAALPGQFPRVSGDDDKPEMYEQFNSAEFAYDDYLWLRIRNAAKLCGKTPREFIWSTIWGAVKECESQMIVSPRDSRFLADRFEFCEFLLSSTQEE